MLRRTRTLQTRRPLGPTSAFLIALTLLAGCGNESKGTAPVTLNLVMAGQRAEVPSRFDRLWVSLRGWLIGEPNAWAAGVADIASTRVEISAPDISPPQSITVSVSNPTSGQVITVELDVKAGTNRTITVSAMNAAGAVIFSGTATGVNLTAGVPSAVTITLFPFSTALKITVLGSGPQLNGPLANIRILRHDATTGAFLDERTTGSEGVADFGDIGTNRTTISVVTTQTFPGGPGFAAIEVGNTLTFLNVGAGDLKLNLGTNFGVTGQSTPPASVAPTLTSLPTGTTSALVFSGGFSSTFGATAPPGQVITPPNFTFPFPLAVRQLQSDGLFSLLGLATNAGNAIVACGRALDLPATATTATIPMTVPVGTTSFTANEPVFFEGTQLLRKGVIFDVFNFFAGTTPASSISGSFQHCPLPGDGSILGAEKVAFEFDTSLLANGNEKQITKIFDTAAVSPMVAVTLPDLTITSLSRTGQTVSWTSSGGSLPNADFVDVILSWSSGSFSSGGSFVFNSWIVEADPAAGNVTLPTLPPDLSNRIPPAGNTASVSVAVFGLDGVNGFADLGKKFIATGDFDRDVKFALATEMFEVERDLASVSVGRSQFGTITSPVGINCGPPGFTACLATVPDNSTVTVTAVPQSGSTFTGWVVFPSTAGTCPNTSDTCTVSVLAGGNVFVSATFTGGVGVIIQ